MQMVGLTPKIKKILLESGYVEGFTEKDFIKFKETFKDLVLKQSSEGVPRLEIFKVLGVDIFTRNYINSCISQWRRSSREKSSGKIKKKKGRRKSLEQMTVDELRAENALQKQEIEYLKKLRGLTK